MDEANVYVLADARGRILRCEGGYTLGSIRDLDAWIRIDSGSGDRFNLCQTHYFEGGLYTDEGIPRWKLTADGPALREAAEIREDLEALPEKNDDDVPVTWGALKKAYEEGVLSA